VAIAVEATGTLVVVDAGLSSIVVGAILRVDPRSGDRSALSGGIVGSGPPLQGPVAIAVEAAGTLVVLDMALSGPRVLRVDPVSGTRTIVADAPAAGGPDVDSGDIAVEATGDLVVLEKSSFPRLIRVVRVDPVSGVRSLVFDATTGSGPVPVRPVGLAVEATGTLVLVDTGARRFGSRSSNEVFGLGAVVRVEARSGDRALISR
jgi:sugar lactone lactonase YvrE